jgi:hypothetical protein
VAKSNVTFEQLQFARLLSEIHAAGILKEHDWDLLLAEMDLVSDDLTELFDRAHEVWDKAKETQRRKSKR